MAVAHQPRLTSNPAAGKEIDDIHMHTIIEQVQSTNGHSNIAPGLAINAFIPTQLILPAKKIFVANRRLVFYCPPSVCEGSKNIQA